MLKTLDVFIGLATVMLFFSLAVTVLTQMATSLLNSRGTALLYGLERLLRQIWPQLDMSTAKSIAEFLLRHPAIAAKGEKLGSVIQREEMVFLLLEAAAGESPEPLEPSAKRVLCQLLAQGGVRDPASVLLELRRMTLDLERLRPELGASQRRTMAILKAASGEFTAKLFGWFDQTIDRVSEAFTQHTRYLSLCGAVLVVLLFQIDSIWIIQRLSSDEATRTAMVAQAKETSEAEDRVKQMDPAGRTPQTDQARLVMANYDSLGLIQLPWEMTFRDWWSGWMNWHRLIGAFFSVLLLSLGAPFWYDALKNMIKLRSVLSGRDDDQREARQEPDKSAPGLGSLAGGSSAASITVGAKFDLDGERGDLTAIG